MLFFPIPIHVLLRFDVGQSKKSGEKAIEYTLELQKSLTAARKQESDILQQILECNDPSVLLEINEQMQAITKNRELLETRYKKAMQALGVDDQRNMKKLLQNDYLMLRMNARALKTRLRKRLRERKFEQERLERSYRNVLNGMFTTLI